MANWRCPNFSETSEIAVLCMHAQYKFGQNTDKCSPIAHCLIMLKFGRLIRMMGLAVKAQRTTGATSHGGAMHHKCYLFTVRLRMHTHCLAIDICPSDCLSNAWIVTKRKNSLSIFQHRTTQRCFWFLEAKFRNPDFRGSPRTSVLKRGTPLSKAQIRPIICNNFETVRDRM